MQDAGSVRGVDDSAANGRLALSKSMMDSMRAFVHTGDPDNATANLDWQLWPRKLLLDADLKAARLSAQ